VHFDRILFDVYNNSLDGIVISDCNTIITHVNPAYVAMTGYQPQEIVGQRTNFIKSGMTPRAVFLDMWERLDRDGKWVGEIINTHKDGHLWYSYLSITAIRNDEGKAVAYVGIARDITRRIQMEQGAVNNANRLRSILESVGEAIIMVDTAGVCVVANKQVSDVLEIPADKVVGRPIQEVRSQSSLMFDDSQVPQGEVKSTLLNRRGDSPRLFYEISAPVKDDAGQITGRIYVYRDVTRETEVDRMKSDFIATVSHELRTPMTSIKGSLGLVLGGIAGEVPSDAKELLEIALNNTDRLIRLINDILDISKIEAGKMELRLMPLTINDAIVRAVQEIEGYAAQRSIRVSTDVQTRLPRSLADGDRLQQVLVNLLSNAIKFSEPGSAVRIMAVLDGRALRISVQDEGPGIAPEQQRHIFEKFHRVDNASTRKTGGTGLGLAICKAIIEEHGGRIWVESQVGVGSTFRFTLPVEPAVAELPLQAEAGGRSVLVVDDGADVRWIVGFIMDRAGYSVRTAPDGKEAYSMIMEQKPDLLILDLLMPNLDGFQLVRLLRQRSATKRIPMIVLTALDLTEKDRALLQLGPTRHLTKGPRLQEEIAALTQELMG